MEFTETLLNGYIKNGKVTKPVMDRINGFKNGKATLISNQPSEKSKGAEHADKSSKNLYEESFEWPGIMTIFMAQLSYMVLTFLAFLNIILFPWRGRQESNRVGYPGLYNKKVTAYLIYVYRRIRDCWNIPVVGVPGVEMMLKDRVTEDRGWTFKYTGTQHKYINLGSYNYLGFAQSDGPCADAAVKSVYEYGVSTCTSRYNYGTQDYHRELEQLTAEFVGTEDSVSFGMGFATNAYNIPILVSPGCLVVSDSKNHASIIMGIKFSGAKVQLFKHNDERSLERVLQKAIVNGQPNRKEHTPWKKILIIVEGVYSMDGTIAKLPEFIALKKKYKAYLFIDEAHSIGALGKHGRGAVDYYGCDPNDIDVLMGTFTKSFGSAGGYIAGKKVLIDAIKKHSFAHRYATAMAPPVAAQIISVLKILLGKDGTNEGMRRIDSLARNTQYFRKRVAQLGMITYGNANSPVVPILVYNFSKVTATMRKLLERNVAAIGVGYPAVPLCQARLRICLSAGHTKEQIDDVIKTLSEVGDEVGIKYSRRPIDPTPIDYDSLLLY